MKVLEIATNLLSIKIGCTATLLMAYLLIKQISNDLATLNPNKRKLCFLLMLIIKCKKLLLKEKLNSTFISL
jgi:hypothetical protein